MLFAAMAMALNTPPLLPGDDADDIAVSDVDHRLIGLSPQYWSYTPLLIGDLVGLPLINGIECFVAPSPGGTHDDEGLREDKDGCQDTRNKRSMSIDDEVNDESDRDWKNCQPKSNHGPGDKSRSILPLSRVLLRGIATAVDRRPNGCTLIVLDDGTGSIDCRCWDDSHGGDGGAFNLPPLLPEHERFDGKRRGLFRFVVGDSLEVMGKIKSLTAGSSAKDDDGGKCRLSDDSPVPLDVRFGCVREVHATSVCVIGEGQTRMANQWNAEVVHWLKCMEFGRRFSSQCDSTDNHGAIRSGKDVLPLLGKTISSSILDGGSGDFSTLCKARGNVLQRKCCQTPRRFREALFYCHCEATLEALDPFFRFRDALLNRLLDIESRLRRCADCSHPIAVEDCMDLLGAAIDSMPPPLLFTFQSVYTDEELMAVAGETAASSNLPGANAQRLVRKTFAAMANDGILSLCNLEEDLYLLVTRARVIEPFLGRSRVRESGGFGATQHIPQPFFIRSVPKKRLAEVKNWMEDNFCSS